MILDFLNEQLPWRNCKENKVDEVRDVKTACLNDPENMLWKTTTANIPEVRNIFNMLRKLQYADCPDYDYIARQLQQILDRETAKTAPTKSSVNSKRPRKAQKESMSPVIGETPPPLNIENNMVKIPRLDDMPFPGASIPPMQNPAQMPPPMIPPSYYAPNSYMMGPPQGYPNMFYQPFSRLMMHPSMIQNHEDQLIKANEEQKIDQNAVLPKPYSIPFHPMMMQYQPTAFSKDRIQFVTPNFININNVNTLGTALIINNGGPPKQAEVPPEIKNPIHKSPEKINLNKDGYFKIEVDQEFYRKLYSEHN